MKKYLLILIFIAPTSWASGYTTSDNTATVSWVNVESGLVRVSYSHPNKLNPDECGSSSAIVINGESQWVQMQYSAILAALMAGKNVRFYVNGCVPGWGTSYPKLTAVYVFN